MTTTTTTVVDTLAVTGSPLGQRQVTAASADMLDVAGRPAPAWRLHQAVRDVVRLVGRSSAAAVWQVLVASRLSLTGIPRSALSAVLHSTIALRGSLTAAQKVRLADVLRVKLTATAAAEFAVTLRELVRLTDQLPGMKLGGVLRETLRLRSAVSRAYVTTAEIASRLELTDVLTPKLVILAIAQDAVVLDAFEGVQAIYSGVLNDTVDFVVDLVNPSGDVTTWAVNSRTGAVTEYLNYAFNSFATSGNGTYLGAADDGLYELVGPDDAGEPIVADIISGLVDFSGSFLSSLQAVYLGVRGKGEFFLKITEATGRATTYAVKATSLKTARVNIGKGLRARYFTYELISTGQDFDLTDITFLPVQQTRRV